MPRSDLAALQVLDGLKYANFGNLPCYVHTDHRWVLPIIHHAQEQGHIPRPCTLVMFDAHHDALPPQGGCMDLIRQIRASGPTVDSLLQLCEVDDGLRKTDDDWVLAGMELGLIGDAVVFGVKGYSDRDVHDLWEFADHAGTIHHLRLVGLPGRELGYQGVLGDLSQREVVQSIWDILGWKMIDGRFQFVEGRPKIALDIDLDCFVVDWNGYLFPWPDEVFEHEFLRESMYWSTQQQSGLAFLQVLIEKAGSLTIAREPHYCGGHEKTDEVFRKLNRHLFGGNIIIHDD